MAGEKITMADVGVVVSPDVLDPGKNAPVAVVDGKGSVRGAWPLSLVASDVKSVGTVHTGVMLPTLS